MTNADAAMAGRPTPGMTFVVLEYADPGTDTNAVAHVTLRGVFHDPSDIPSVGDGVNRTTVHIFDDADVVVPIFDIPYRTHDG